MFNIGILSVSDRAYKGIYDDLGGGEVSDFFCNHFKNELNFIYEVIPDEEDVIIDKLITLSKECNLVVTTGGTGPAKRDVTPDATIKICDKLLPGFGELMRRVSYEITPTAILSRQVAGIRGNTLIINLPGKPKAIKECLKPLLVAIVDCLDLLEISEKIDIDEKFKRH